MFAQTYQHMVWLPQGTLKVSSEKTISLYKDDINEDNLIQRLTTFNLINMKVKLLSGTGNRGNKGIKGNRGNSSNNGNRGNKSNKGNRGNSSNDAKKGSSSNNGNTDNIRSTKISIYPRCTHFTGLV